MYSDRFVIRSVNVPSCAVPLTEDVREHLLNRDPEFRITACSSFMQKPEALSDLISGAYRIHKPFRDDDFDYLRQNIRSCTCRLQGTQRKVEITVSAQYLTSAEEEKTVFRLLEELLADGVLHGKNNELLKTKWAYDYILSHVDYDKTLRCHSVYDALVHGKTVCEGCSALLYRILTRTGVSCRILTGRGMRELHSWNIVKVGSLWYNLDVTWDLYSRQMERTLANYQWFLRGSAFPNHTRNPEFDTPEFHACHPMAQTDYYRSSTSIIRF